MLDTQRTVLSCMEGQMEFALGLLDEAQAAAERAAKICGPGHMDTCMIRDAIGLRADADNELSKARCLQKLIRGEVPSKEEQELGRTVVECAWQLLHNRREFASIDSIDTEAKWWKAIWAAKLTKREIGNEPMDPVQEALPEPEFVWDVHHDYSAQSDRYIPHLRRLISLGGQDTEWVDGHEYPDLLSYYGMYALGYNLEGTTDVLVAKRPAVMALLPAEGAQVLFDVRKQVTGADLIRGEVRLVLANLHAPFEKPVVVVTDLQKVWHILWMDGADICRCPFPTRANAVKVINDILAGSIKAGQGGTQAAIAWRHRIAKHMFEDAE